MMVAMSKIKQYCEGIAAGFSPQRIILFGSHAYGKPNPDSDVDVMVIMRDAAHLGRHPEATIRMKVRADFPVDMLVRDEKEVDRRLRDKDTFMLDVLENGKVMYEAVHA